MDSPNPCPRCGAAPDTIGVLSDDGREIVPLKAILNQWVCGSQDTREWMGFLERYGCLKRQRDQLRALLADVRDFVAAELEHREGSDDVYPSWHQAAPLLERIDSLPPAP